MFLSRVAALCLIMLVAASTASADDDCKGNPKLVREGQTFVVALDPSKSSLALFKDGAYDHATVQPYLSPAPKGGKRRKITVIAYYATDQATTTMVEEMLRGAGMRPLTGHEALAFGATHKMIQMRYPLAALGRAYMVGDDAMFIKLLGLSTGREAAFDDGRCWPGGKKQGVRFLATQSESVRR